MKNNKLVIFICILLVLIITLVVFANFTVAPYVTNIEINESKKYDDKLFL